MSSREGERDVGTLSLEVLFVRKPNGHFEDAPKTCVQIQINYYNIFYKITIFNDWAM